MEKKRCTELAIIANKVRKNALCAVYSAQSGHPGGSLSVADVLTLLYFEVMKIDPKNPKDENRDRFVLSKGHTAPALYSVLAERGYFSTDEIPTFRKFGSRLQGHPDMRKLTGIEANTGSLGQGVSLAAGLAAGLKLDHLDSRVYVAVGDGELAEGQLWEAFMAVAYYKLDNLRVIIDRNGLQATGKTKERFDIGSIEEKMKAFGFEVLVIDGHDLDAIAEAFDRADQVKEKPVCIIADTIKGKGIPFAEGVASFHNGTLTEEQYEEALKVLG